MGHYGAHAAEDKVAIGISSSIKKGLILRVVTIEISYLILHTSQTQLLENRMKFLIW